MSAWAKPGVKCVLVYPNPNWHEVAGFVNVPIPAVMYTVSDVVICDGEVCIRLAEIWNDDYFQISRQPPIVGAPVFGAFRFRPVVPATEQDDVALFAHHLDRVGEPA